MRYDSNTNPAQRQRPPYIEEALSLLKDCLTRKPPLQDVLHALWNLDGIYGSRIKGATSAFKQAWFIDDLKCRHEELTHVLSRIVAHVCRADAIFLAPDQPVTSSDPLNEEVDLDDISWLYRHQPLHSTADLDAFFSEPLPGSPTPVSQTRQGSLASAGGEHQC